MRERTGRLAIPPHWTESSSPQVTSRRASSHLSPRSTAQDCRWRETAASAPRWAIRIAARLWRSSAVAHRFRRRYRSAKRGGLLRSAPSLNNEAPAIPGDLLAAHVVGPSILVLNWWVDAQGAPSPRQVDELFLALVGPALEAAGRG